MKMIFSEEQQQQEEEKHEYKLSEFVQYFAREREQLLCAASSQEHERKRKGARERGLPACLPATLAREGKSLVRTHMYVMMLMHASSLVRSRKRERKREKATE
jgi:hypothetical protein